MYCMCVKNTQCQKPMVYSLFGPNDHSGEELKLQIHVCLSCKLGASVAKWLLVSKSLALPGSDAFSFSELKLT